MKPVLPPPTTNDLVRLLDAACAAERELAWSDENARAERTALRDAAQMRYGSALTRALLHGRIDLVGYRRLLGDAVLALSAERDAITIYRTPLFAEAERGHWQLRDERDRKLLRAWRWARCRAMAWSALARVRGAFSWHSRR